MHVQWFGQSAFLLSDGTQRVFVDPFFVGDAIPMRFEYPAIEGVEADVLLVTHEHPDHNNVGAVGGEPAVVRCAEGATETPIGTVTGIASEHDAAGGTQAGPNVIYRFAFDELDVVFLGDLGQSELRPEQVEAIGTPDVLFVPVGGGYTIGSDVAEQISRLVGARWLVPMHYSTSAFELPEGVEAFAERFDAVQRTGATAELTAHGEGDGDGDGPTVVILPMPGGADG